MRQKAKELRLVEQLASASARQMAEQGDQQDHHHRDPHAGEGNGAALLKPGHSGNLFQLRPRFPRVPSETASLSVRAL